MMQKAVLLILMLGVGLKPVHSQCLKRSGTLGIYPAPISGGEAMRAGLEGTAGVKVAKILKGSAAEAMGLEVGDFILEVNGEAVANPAGIVAQLGQLSAGDPVALTGVRSGEPLQKQGVMQARELPQPAGAKAHYGAVPFEGGCLRSFLEVPAGPGPFPVIYYLQGYPCQTVAHANPIGPMRRLINQWLAAGYAVYRVEKPGVGESAGPPDCHSINFETELDAFRAGYDALLKETLILNNQVFLYGHSLGGVVAPFLARQFKPAGVMVYGFVLKPWKDYMFDVMWDQRVRTGADPAAAMEELLQGRKLLNAYFDENKAPSDFLKTEAERALFGKLLAYDGQSQCFGRHYSFWQDIDNRNLPAIWQEVTCPVLSMYGEYDLAAIDERGARQLANLINQQHPGQGTFQLIEQTNHALLQMPDFDAQLDYAASADRGLYYRDNFNTGFAQQLVDWMAAVLDRT